MSELVVMKQQQRGRTINLSVTLQQMTEKERNVLAEEAIHELFLTPPVRMSCWSAFYSNSTLKTESLQRVLSDVTPDSKWSNLIKSR